MMRILNAFARCLPQECAEVVAGYADATAACEFLVQEAADRYIGAKSSN